MRSLTRIQPLGYLKVHTAKVIRDVAATRVPLVITQHGVAKAVIRDAASHDETQETMALLKILALGNHQIEEDKVVPVKEAVRRLARGRRR